MGFFGLGKIRFWGDLITIFQDLKEGYKKQGNRFFRRICCDRKRGNRFKKRVELDWV